MSNACTISLVVGRQENIIIRKLLLSLVIIFLLNSSFNVLANTLLHDDFEGNFVSSNNWHIPTWVSPTDGTFVGQTQFRCIPTPLPSNRNGAAIIPVESFNPTAPSTAPSFYGTDLISNLSFPKGQGIHIKVRAKMLTSKAGIVGGIFLYALKPESPTLHDEIDFELLTSNPYGAQINIYSNEELGSGHPQFIYYSSGWIYDYHTYEINWQPNQVTWFIDGALVWTDTNHVPSGPMNFHLNIWVPGLEWAEAYNPDLIPTTSSISNQVFSMNVDSVNIQSITPAAGALEMVPILHFLLLDKTP